MTAWVPAVHPQPRPSAQHTRFGNASGFAIDDLPNIASTKTVDGSSCILDFIVTEVAEKSPQLLPFTVELRPACELRGVTLGNVKSGVKALTADLNKIRRAIGEFSQQTDDWNDLNDCSDEFAARLRTFHEDADGKRQALEDELAKVEALRREVWRMFVLDAEAVDETGFFEKSIAPFCLEFDRKCVCAAARLQ